VPDKNASEKLLPDLKPIFAVPRLTKLVHFKLRKVIQPAILLGRLEISTNRPISDCPDEPHYCFAYVVQVDLLRHCDDSPSSHNNFIAENPGSVTGKYTLDIHTLLIVP
jgi:hypothetical protein